MSQDENNEGDSMVGRLLFISKCQTCHNIEPHGKPLSAPNLRGIMGRRAGIVKGFPYSEANKNIGITWNRETMDKFLEDPGKFMPGTKMLFPKIKDRSDRNDLIAFLEENS